TAHERRDARRGGGGEARWREHEHVIAHTDAPVGAAIAGKRALRRVHAVLRCAPVSTRKRAAGNPATPTSSTSTRPASGSAARWRASSPRVAVVTKSSR